MEIQPGATLTIEIIGAPPIPAAQKTLLRLCRKDPQVSRRLRKFARRPSWEKWRRGGRMWHHQMRSRPGVNLTAGARYSLRATVDVIRDLQTVQRWVKVTAK